MCYLNVTETCVSLIKKEYSVNLPLLFIQGNFFAMILSSKQLNLNYK